MNLKIIAENVKRLRAVNKISQQSLAELSGISLPAIKKLEGAKNEPRVDTLRAISRALDVKLQELFQPSRQLNSVRFRSNKRMRNRENILAQVAIWLDDFNSLEDMLNEHIPFKLDGIHQQCLREDALEAALLCRRELGLKTTEPIHNICGLLENIGIKILSISYASNDFFGLCIGQDDGGPAVVVNVWGKIPAERRIFSAAHEFGHLMLHQDSLNIERTDEDKQEEEEANIFAAHFLMPNEGFIKEWNAAAGLSMIERVFKVKRIYSVSYKAILWRLIEIGGADNTIWKKFNFAYRQRFKRKLSFKEEPWAISSSEPYGLKDIDFYESRFSSLVKRAVEEEQISISRGAEILKITIDEMQERLAGWGSVL